MNLGEAAAGEWNEQDLSAMLRHRLSAPLDFDGGSLEPKGSRDKGRYRILSEAAALGIRTFHDLFRHPRPPLTVLRITKDFFKVRAGSAAERRPEQEVDYLIYLLSIFAARVRTGHTITKLSDSELLRGVEWAATRKWADEETVALLGMVRQKLLVG